MGRPSVGVVFTSKIREWLKTGLLQVRPEQQELRHHALGSGSFSHDTTRNVVVGIDMRACFASHGSMEALWSEFFWLPSCSRQSFILSLLLFPSPTRSVGLSEVARTVRSELGAEISELFREFDQKAIAAASLAQVSTVVAQCIVAQSSARPGKERYKKK